MMHDIIFLLQPHYGANEAVVPDVCFTLDHSEWFASLHFRPSSTTYCHTTLNRNLQTLLQSLSESNSGGWGCERLKYRSEQTGARFTLKALLCHVLFKLPSAGTPICTSPQGPVVLCVPSSIQAAYHSSITRSSLHLFPSQSIHPQRTEDTERRRCRRG